MSLRNARLLHSEFSGVGQSLIVVFQIFPGEMLLYSWQGQELISRSIHTNAFKETRFHNDFTVWYNRSNIGPSRAGPLKFEKDSIKFTLNLWRWEPDCRFLGYFNVIHEKPLLVSLGIECV